MKFVGIVAFFCILVFVFRAFILLDPDFGWHYKMGEIITSMGIPHTDPLSYTMPSFPFVDHEWLTNIFIYKLFLSGGFLVLIAVYTIFSFLALYVALSINKGYLKGKLCLFVLSAATFIQYFGVRPQVISWFFLSILLLVFFKTKLWEKWRFLLPLFFLIWVNMHGSFGAGIVILGTLIFLRMVRLRRILWQDVVVGMLCLGATFINPYGEHVWREVLQQVTDSSVRWTISEWTPSFLTFNIPFFFFACLSALLLTRYRKKYFLEEKGLFLGLLLQSIGATRHVPLWTLFAIYITLKGWDFLNSDVKKIKYGRKRLNEVTQYGLVFIVVIFVYQSAVAILNGAQLREELFYPKAAIEYLKSNKQEGRLFSEYGWGGYLDWKYPSEKVFVDGRMATWRWSTNPVGEEGYVFGTYNDLLSGEIDYKPVFEKYNITAVLWPKERVQGIKINLPFLLKKEKQKTFSELLQESGWSKVYEDEVALVIIRP